MTPRKRSQDLTADLLHDLEAEEAAAALAPLGHAETQRRQVAPQESRPPVRPVGAARAPAPARTVLGKPEPAPFVVTSLYLAPRGWRRPAVSFAGASVLFSAGPVRLRIGHAPS